MVIGGPLNPKYVESMMGLFTDHTESKLWGIAWFRSKRKRLSKG